MPISGDICGRSQLRSPDCLGGKEQQHRSKQSKQSAKSACFQAKAEKAILKQPGYKPVRCAAGMQHIHDIPACKQGGMRCKGDNRDYDRRKEREGNDTDQPRMPRLRSTSLAHFSWSSISTLNPASSEAGTDRLILCLIGGTVSFQRDIPRNGKIIGELVSEPGLSRASVSSRLSTSADRTPGSACSLSARVSRLHHRPGAAEGDFTLNLSGPALCRTIAGTGGKPCQSAPESKGPQPQRTKRLRARLHRAGVASV